MPRPLALLTVTCAVLGCGAPSSVVTAAPSVPPLEDAPSGAFAVYDGDSTTLVPVDPRRAVARAEGWWLALPDAPETVVRYALPRSAADAGLASCCEPRARACIGTPVRRTYRGGVWTSDPRCACWAESSAGAADDAADDGADDAPECDRPEPERFDRISMVGGVIYSYAAYLSVRDECGQMSGLVQVEREVIFDGAPVAAAPRSWSVCASRHLVPDDLVGAEGVVARPTCTPGDVRDEACQACGRGPGEDAWAVLARGRLCTVSLAVTAGDDAVSWVSCAPARPERCPSALDPCGDPAAFADSISDDVDWWVSTDGQWALADGVVLRAGQAEPVRAEDVSAAVGVLFVPDARALLEAMARGEETAGEPDGACPPAASVASCAHRGECGAGACVDGRCVDGCDAARSAREHGNACARSMRTEDWEAARRACLCALAAGPTPAVEGAVRYSLGRVAEGLGELDEARRQYRRSLEVRPGNAIVESRLVTLD